MVRNWLNGLRLWHIYNRAQWHGKDEWVIALKSAADKEGVIFCRPPQAPITKDHLRALYNALDFSIPSHVSIWFAATAAFSGCRRLGEFLIKSVSFFDPTHDVSRAVTVSTSSVNGHEVDSLPLPWTKTTGIQGGLVILTATGDFSCPTTARRLHLAVNPLKVSDGTGENIPLFAYYSGNSWTPLTKSYFLTFTSR